MSLFVRGVVAVFAALKLCTAPVVAAAGIPGSVAMAEMRTAAQGHGLRLIGTFGQREFRHLELDSTGVRALVPRSRSALFVTADTPPPAMPAPIAWNQIAEVRTTRQLKLRGALTGATIGLVLSATTTGLKSGSYRGENLQAGLLMVGSATAGALVGTFIGSLSGSKTLYRAREID